MRNVLKFIGSNIFCKAKNRKGVIQLGSRHITPRYSLTSSPLIVQLEVPASQKMAIQTSPQASHRVCPTLGLKRQVGITKKQISSQMLIAWTLAYILHLKEEVFRKHMINIGFYFLVFFLLFFFLNTWQIPQMILLYWC